MKILVDADACPVKEMIIKIAKKHHIEVIMFIDTSHVIQDSYAKVVTVDKAKDSVDIALFNKLEKGDIVVTQDFGLAAMALSKGAHAMNQNGLLFTNDNIERLLFERHLSQKSRRAGLKGTIHQKRKAQDDVVFEKAFMQCIQALKDI